METLSVVDLTAAPAPLAALERLPAGARVVVLPFPPARDAREFGRLGRAVKRARVVAVIAHPLFGRPCWAKVMEWLASGVLGSLERLEFDRRESSPGGDTAGPGGETSLFTPRPDQGNRGLWPALDFVLRLPAGLPGRLCFHETPEAQELCSAANPAAAPLPPVVCLTWRPPGAGGPAERLLIQAANGRLELIADRRRAATARMVLATGHEKTEAFAESQPGPPAMAWARHVARHGLDGGPLALGRLAPLYDWLARA